MNVQKRNDVSIYCLSAGAALPEWLGDRARRNLSKTNESVRRRVTLLQDFQMPASSSKLCMSRDGRYILAAGTYPPRIRCYDVDDLSLKFERYTNAAVTDLLLLGEDYGKCAVLLDDRTVALHAHYGFHESVRIPSFGRAMAYEPSTCELLVAAAGCQVYRLNLQEGRFSEPWMFDTLSSSSSSSNSNNKRSNKQQMTTGNSNASGTCIAVHQQRPLAAVGCDDGTVRLWDSRSSDSMLRPFLNLNVSAGASELAKHNYASNHYGSSSSSCEITSLAHDPSGLYMCAGTSTGLVALYDVRSSRPLHVQEHKHGGPIHTCRFHTSSGTVMSADEKLIKVWRYKASSRGSVAVSGSWNHDREAPDDPTISTTTNSSSSASTNVGSLRVNIEGNNGGKLTHFIVAGDESDPHGDASGVILAAKDQPKMDSFYVPALGVAPKWCSYLENITEELEERDLQRDTNSSSMTQDDLVRSGQETVFENYKFVTRDDLDALGVSNLIGTPLLRGYMHGFFMDLQLYNRVKAVANPFEYQEYTKRKLKERLDAKQSSRIAPRKDKSNPNGQGKSKKTKATVNPELADRLESKASTGSSKAAKTAKGLLSDNRFGSLFTNPDYEIDEEDEDFRLRNPSGVAAKNKRNNLDSDEDDDDISGEDESVGEGSVQNDDDGYGNHKVSRDTSEHLLGGNAGEIYSDSEDDGFQGGKVRGEAYEEIQDSESKKSAKHTVKAKRKAKRTRPVMLEAEVDNATDAVATFSRDDVLNLPLAERKARHDEKRQNQPRVSLQVGGSKEVTYIPQNNKQKKELPFDDAESPKRQRRGVKELGFKKPHKQSHQR